MTELIKPPGLAGQALVAPTLITQAAYKVYLRELGRPLPPSLTRGGGSPNRPATYVSQIDAVAYCQWLGRQEGHAYRLPSMAELMALYSRVEDTGPEGWSALTTHNNPVSDEHGCHCEWTCETETMLSYDGGESRILGSIFYPPWLREGSNAIHAQARMSATDGFSFVGFRVACDG
jgi:hypothetical protein